MSRFVAEIPCITGAGLAAFLAYHDKPWWVWMPFLVFACLNILTTGPKT